jgi:hypothetical protein
LTLSISLEEVNKKNVKITENVIVCGTEIGFKTGKKLLEHRYISDINLLIIVIEKANSDVFKDN